MKPIRKFFKKIGLVLKPIVRGALKSIPIVNPIIEIITNISNEVKGTVPTVNGEPVKHNYLSILVQIVCVACIVWAFYSKTITIEDLVKLLKDFTSQDAQG